MALAAHAQIAHACSRIALVCFSLGAAAALAATITVTGTGDNIAVDGSVTLREAIASINAGANINADVVAVGGYGALDTINFSIPGAGVHTIAPASALPAVTKPALIDGYTQPGASFNTNALNQGTNAVLLIELDLAGNLGSGLNLTGGNGIVRGLVINRSPGPGITVSGSDWTIAGNFIGTNPAGTAAGPGNAGDGIAIGGASVMVGGLAVATRNVISGNGGAGIRVSGGGTDAKIGANLIGTDAAGTAALANGAQGVALVGGTHLVGSDTVSSASNVISGNAAQGVLATSTGDGTSITGNYIGVDVGGDAALGNQGDGVTINADSVVVGVPFDGNVISGNGGNGISMTGNTNIVESNRIGPGAGGASIGNALAGVAIQPFSNDNEVDDNTIAVNSGPAVQVFGAGATGGTGNTISANFIDSNGALGIKLGSGSASTPTPNDAGDADTGPNNLQNFPVITAASVVGLMTTVSGTLNSHANTLYRVEFFTSATCDPSGNGEGQIYVGFSANVMTDGSGNATFGPLSFSTTAPGGSVVTATATDQATGDTSEFSQCFNASGGPMPTLSINDVAQSEGNAGTTNFVFTVTISSTANASVNFATANGTATAGSDYVANSGTVTFTSGGPLTQTITVAVNGDTTVEPDEAFVVNLSGASGATIADAQGLGTIVNDDAALPTLAINNMSANEGNSGTTPFVFTVTLSAASASTVMVNYATADGTATAPSDYAVTSGTLMFNPGVTTQTITVNVVGDTVVEANETFTVTLSGPTNATIATGAGTGTIINDDGAGLPTLSINSVSANEGNAGTTPFTFTVTLSAASASTVTVSFATADGSATAGSDYVATSGTLTFNPGVTTQTITVNVNGDPTPEANETFFANLSSPANATIAVGQGAGTIVNDDAAPPPPEVTAPIPTLSQWALIALAMFVACLGWARIANGRRRDRKAPGSD
jgi:hypothetical protein